jgi:hypothetical protein
LGPTVPQFGPTTGMGRKRSATSAAPASGHRRSVAKRMASASNFSPTHFDEPVSSGPVPPSPNTPYKHSSAARVAPENNGHVKGSQLPSLPSSSPISHNPLLGREDHMVIQTPSPPRRRPQSFRTHDGDTAWPAAKGLLPVREGFVAPGYVPAQLVGGVTYTVRSPQAGAPRPQQPIVREASVARHLFGEYERQQPHASQARNLPQQVAPDDRRQQPIIREASMARHLLPQKVAPNNVSLCMDLL